MKSWKTVEYGTPGRAGYQLQWSHDGEVVEDVDPRGGVILLGRLQWSHDGEVVEDFGSLAASASISILQWSHDGEVVEDRSWRGLINGGRVTLQWSHDGEVVEDGRKPRYDDRGDSNFNGATTVKSWKTRRRLL